MIKRGKENVHAVIEKGVEIVFVQICWKGRFKFGSFDSLLGYAACGVGARGGFRYIQEPIGRTLG